jgi:hypothetical protein
MRTNHDEHQEIMIRRLDGAHRDALVRLAERDSSPAPKGPEVLGAMVEGELMAATSVAGGDTVADPFTHSVRARALVESRAAEIRRASRGGGRLKRLLGRRSRAALPSSPPGGGGRFLIPPPPECR